MPTIDIHVHVDPFLNYNNSVYGVFPPWRSDLDMIVLVEWGGISNARKISDILNENANREVAIPAIEYRTRGGPSLVSEVLLIGLEGNLPHKRYSLGDVINWAHDKDAKAILPHPLLGPIVYYSISYPALIHLFRKGIRPDGIEASAIFPNFLIKFFLIPIQKMYKIPILGGSDAKHIPLFGTRYSEFDGPQTSEQFHKALTQGNISLGGRPYTLTELPYAITYEAISTINNRFRK